MKCLAAVPVILLLGSLAMAADQKAAAPAASAPAAPARPAATGPAGTAPAAGDLTVETWYFRWTVAVSGSKSFAIEKTNAGLRAVLSGQIESLWMSPKAAREVGEALAHTDEYAKKLETKRAALKEDKTQTVTEIVEASDCTVVFRIDPTYGFGVSVRSVEGKATVASVLLDQADANALAPFMRKAEAMAAYIDKRVKP